jgi:hypothetical protein
MTRRRLMATGAIVSAAIPFASIGRAQGLKPNVSRAASWALGSKLSFAALGHGRGAPQETVDRLLNDAKSIATSLGVTVRPFPPKGKDSADTMATLIHYLIKGDGWNTGEELLKKFDRTHGTLFEIAVKSNLLLLLYAPGNDSGIGSIIKSRSEQIKLAPELWSNVVTLIANKAPANVVREAVFKMHKDVQAHLLNA